MEAFEHVLSSTEGMDLYRIYVIYVNIHTSSLSIYIFIYIYAYIYTVREREVSPLTCPVLLLQRMEAFEHGLSSTEGMDLYRIHVI